MKRLPGKFLILSIFLVGMMDVYAGNGSGAGPPAPTEKVAFDTPPPGLPIDENIFILFSIAMLFGVYIVYRGNFKTKKPI